MASSNQVCCELLHMLQDGMRSFIAYGGGKPAKEFIFAASYAVYPIL